LVSKRAKRAAHCCDHPFSALGQITGNLLVDGGRGGRNLAFGDCRLDSNGVHRCDSDAWAGLDLFDIDFKKGEKPSLQIPQVALESREAIAHAGFQAGRNWIAGHRLHGCLWISPAAQSSDVSR
jgi:hypothetical protein